MDELNSRMERTEGRLNELDDRTIKITQSEQTKADWDSKKKKERKERKILPEPRTLFYNSFLLNNLLINFHSKCTWKLVIFFLCIRVSTEGEISEN